MLCEFYPKLMDKDIKTFILKQRAVERFRPYISHILDYFCLQETRNHQFKYPLPQKIMFVNLKKFIAKTCIFV